MLRLTITAAAVLIVGAVIVPWVAPWQARGTERRVDGRVLGEMQGYVSRVDVEQRTLWLSTNVFGFGARAITLPAAARIRVADKEGGLGDLREGAPAAVLYEVRDDDLVGSWVGVGETLTGLRAAARVAELRDAQAQAESPAVSIAPAAPIPAAPVVSRLASPRARTVSAPRSPRGENAALPAAAPARAGEDPGAVIDWLLKGFPRD